MFSKSNWKPSRVAGDRRPESERTSRRLLAFGIAAVSFCLRFCLARFGQQVDTQNSHLRFNGMTVALPGKDYIIDCGIEQNKPEQEPRSRSMPPQCAA